MKIRTLLFIATLAVAAGCKQKEKQRVAITMSPEPGFGVSDDKPLPIKAIYPADYKPDSVIYFLDSVRIGVKTDTTALVIPTANLNKGVRTVSALVYKDGQSNLGLTNFFALPTLMPERMTYSVVKTFPHDVTATTKGLAYDDGFLYETAGDSLHGEVRKVELETGKVLIKQKLQENFTARGITVDGNNVIVMADKDKVGFVFDKATLKPVKEFKRYAGPAGWSVANSGTDLYYGDGTGHIWIIDKNDFHYKRYLEAFDHESPIKELGELEFIDGYLYAMVYGYDTIVQLDAKGGVTQAINMSNLWPDKVRPKGFNSEENFINGLAWDAKGKRIFITGSRFPSVYQVEFKHYTKPGVAAN